MATLAPEAPAPAPPRIRPTRPSRDVLSATVAVTVSLLPILQPAGPGNTAAADLGILGSILLAVLWVTTAQLPVRFPYMLGVTGLILGGTVAALVSGVPISVALVFLQDLLLLLWAATLALGRHDPHLVHAATTAWCRTACVYAVVGIVAYLIGFTPISGVNGADGVRASYTFADPNLAGNYLVVSLFMIAACKRPRSPGVRFLGYVAVLTAMGFTGSNGAMLTLLIGLVLTFVISRYRRRGLLAGVLALTATTLLAAVLVVFAMPRVDLGALREKAAGSVPLLRDSFGRSGNSSSERATIVTEGYKLYLQGNATGYGPARTKFELQGTQAPYVKEAHNDYLATMLERGLIGMIGLLLLGVAVGVRCARLLVGDLPPPYAEIVPRAWLLVVIAPVMAVAAGFYEVLHFRHLWTWLGIVAALVLAMQDAAHSNEQRRNR
ncbi:MAG: O-antigen ligase family protein [Nocardioidaceae bacterium]